MTSKAAKLKGMKKVVEKVVHRRAIQTHIPAGMATAAPPLGPQLGQRGLNIAAFCKEFNQRTTDVLDAAPMPCVIHVKPDRTYELEIRNPPIAHFLKQAAGTIKLRRIEGETVGKISLKHVYEIALVKHQDPQFQFDSLQETCKKVIGIAVRCGIEVVRGPIDAEEYRAFLEERKLIIDEQEKEMMAKREAKMLRTTS